MRNGVGLDGGASAPTGVRGLASYARASEDFRKRDAQAVQNQHRINALSARAAGCAVVSYYTDNGRSATKAGSPRPAFDRLLSDLRGGAAPDGSPLGGVVCVADDRLYRHAVDFARFFEALTCEPGRIYVDQNGVRDPYSREGLAQALDSLDAASAETRVRSQRVRNWHWSRAIDGAPHSGPRPFGWQEDRITLHPVEAELVRKAIADRIGGTSINTIVREWRALGVTGTRGGTPTPHSVTQIITAPRVCGYRANRGKLLLDPDTGMPVVGQWNVIATPGQWREVCATFEAGSLFMHRGSGAPRLAGTKSARAYLASGFLRCGGEFAECGACGRKLSGGRNTNSRRSPYGYVCTQGRGCGRCAISGPLADDAIARLLFPERRDGPVQLPASVRERWTSGEMELDERRKSSLPFLTTSWSCLARRATVSGTTRVSGRSGVGQTEWLPPGKPGEASSAWTPARERRAGWVVCRTDWPTRRPRTSSSTPTTPSTGGPGRPRPSRKPGGGGCRCCSASATAVVTGAMSSPAKVSRTRRPPPS
ncbi:recombinase family protein [Streptomyces antnestii]|uniref:Recombinase family protein n=1 Tax=Streptomyces antnestii TaxID=2494256 RepID=A0A437PBJ6_9ACTN|nr:recombinase family protein [Streptomyces sp. San01]